MSELPKSIKENQKNLIEKKYSCLELVEAYLRRIRKYDDKLNSLITVSDELAYSQAKKTDRQIKELGRKLYEVDPLFGTVVVYKDLFLTKGIRTTAGSKVLEFYVPIYSSTVVKRLEDAGCITIGKANCDAWGHGASGENSDFGPTKNPWNTKFVPGGSSSGSAASLKAGFCLVSTGTDTGGSIRQPASFCGVVGLKPTYGSVSRYGVIAMASSLDSIGHMGINVEDVEKVYEITKGEDKKDATLRIARYQIPKRKLILGVPKEYLAQGLNREVRRALEETINVFTRMNFEVIDVSLPLTKYAISVYYIVQPAEVSSNLARYDGVRYANDRFSFGDEAKRRIMLGNYVLSAGYYDAFYIKAMKVRSKIIKEYDEVFKKVDCLLAPVSPTPPFKLREKAGDPLQMYLSDILTVPANIVGIPALAIPCGFTASGLPLGFQLMGQRFSEALLFKLGKLYQRETSWHLRYPNL